MLAGGPSNQCRTQSLLKLISMRNKSTQGSGYEIGVECNTAIKFGRRYGSESVIQIGDFRVAFRLRFKASPGSHASFGSFTCE